MLRKEAVPLFIVFCFFVSAQDTDIKLVHAVFRHGPRTPADTYPNDPYINFTFEPFGWGQLTNQGKMAQFQQGQFLRKRYDTLLGDIYSPYIIIAHSTDIDRTKMSAQLELAGMWPPAPEQKWHPSLDWQPIPIHVQPRDHDDMLLVSIPCPNYYKMQEEALKSAEVQAYLQDLQAPQLYEELTNITGLNISTPDDVQSLYSTLKAEEDFPLELPEWMKQYYPKKMETIVAYSFDVNGYTKEMRAIKGGSLLKKIRQNCQKKIDGTDKRRMYMYSAHDSTVSNLLLALGVWETQIPSYGILALIELHQAIDTNEYGVKVYLRNSTTEEPYLLTIPGCNELCSFNQFLNLTNDVIPDDLHQLCSVDDPHYVPPSPPPV